LRYCRINIRLMLRMAIQRNCGSLLANRPWLSSSQKLSQTAGPT
jgi:hypothetical protein